MATIRKRGPYQWAVQIRRKGYPPQNKTFTTKAEADAWAAMTESEMARGVWISRGEAEDTTLEEALDRYENEILPGKKGAEPERSVIRTWRALKLAKRALASIRSTDVAAARDEWLKLYKPATVLRRLAVLSHLFSIARKEWGMESLSNPVELVRKPQANNARTRRIADVEQTIGGSSDEADQGRGADEGELERIVAATGSTLLPSIIWLAVETAMRRGRSLTCVGSTLTSSVASPTCRQPRTAAPATYPYRPRRSPCCKPCATSVPIGTPGLRGVCSASAAMQSRGRSSALSRGHGSSTSRSGATHSSGRTSAF